MDDHLVLTSTCNNDFDVHDPLRSDIIPVSDSPSSSIDKLFTSPNSDALFVTSNYPLPDDDFEENHTCQPEADPETETEPFLDSSTSSSTCTASSATTTATVNQLPCNDYHHHYQQQYQHQHPQEQQQEQQQQQQQSMAEAIFKSAHLHLQQQHHQKHQQSCTSSITLPLSSPSPSPSPSPPPLLPGQIQTKPVVTQLTTAPEHKHDRIHNQYVPLQRAKKMPQVPHMMMLHPSPIHRRQRASAADEEDEEMEQLSQEEVTVEERLGDVEQMKQISSEQDHRQVAENANLRRLPQKNSEPSSCSTITEVKNSSDMKMENAHDNSGDNSCIYDKKPASSAPSTQNEFLFQRNNSKKNENEHDISNNCNINDNETKHKIDEPVTPTDVKAFHEVVSTGDKDYYKNARYVAVKTICDSTAKLFHMYKAQRKELTQAHERIILIESKNLKSEELQRQMKTENEKLKEVNEQLLKQVAELKKTLQRHNNVKAKTERGHKRKSAQLKNK